MIDDENSLDILLQKNYSIDQIKDFLLELKQNEELNIVKIRKILEKNEDLNNKKNNDKNKMEDTGVSNMNESSKESNTGYNCNINDVSQSKYNDVEMEDNHKEIIIIGETSNDCKRKKKNAIEENLKRKPDSQLMEQSQLISKKLKSDHHKNSQFTDDSEELLENNRYWDISRKNMIIKGKSHDILRRDPLNQSNKDIGLSFKMTSQDETNGKNPNVAISDEKLIGKDSQKDEDKSNHHQYSNSGSISTVVPDTQNSYQCSSDFRKQVSKHCDNVIDNHDHLRNKVKTLDENSMASDNLRDVSSSNNEGSTMATSSYESIRDIFFGRNIDKTKSGENKKLKDGEVGQSVTKLGSEKEKDDVEGKVFGDNVPSQTLNVNLSMEKRSGTNSNGTEQDSCKTIIIDDIEPTLFVNSIEDKMISSKINTDVSSSKEHSKTIEHTTTATNLSKRDAELNNEDDDSTDDELLPYIDHHVRKPQQENEEKNKNHNHVIFQSTEEKLIDTDDNHSLNTPVTSQKILNFLETDSPIKFSHKKKRTSGVSVISSKNVLTSPKRKNVSGIKSPERRRMNSHGKQQLNDTEFSINPSPELFDDEIQNDAHNTSVDENLIEEDEDETLANSKEKESMINSKMVQEQADMNMLRKENQTDLQEKKKTENESDENAISSASSNSTTISSPCNPVATPTLNNNGTSIPINSKPHGLLPHPIEKINKEHPLKLHSKIQLPEPYFSQQIIHIEFDRTDAKILICCKYEVSVWVLDGNDWVPIESIKCSPRHSENFSKALMTSDGEYVIVAGISALVYDDTQVEDGDDENDYTLQHAIKLYAVNGEGIKNGSIVKEHILCLPKVHTSHINDIMISYEHNVIVSCADDGKVVKYQLDPEWISVESHVEMIGITANNEDANTSNTLTVNSLFLISDQKVTAVIGVTQGGIIIWNLETCQKLQVIPCKHLNISRLCPLAMSKRGIFLIGLFNDANAVQSTSTETSTTQRMQCALFFLSNGNIEVKHIYKRKENTGQSSSKDSMSSLATFSDYAAVGTYLGRLHIFNYRTTQCVGVLIDMDGSPVSSVCFHKKLPLLALSSTGVVCFYYQNT